MSYWGIIGPADFVKMGDKVEQLFLADFQSKTLCMKKKRLEKATAPGEVLQVGTLAKKRDRTTTDKSEYETIYNDLKQIFVGSLQEIVLLPKGFPLIDAAGPGRRVYRITVGADDSTMSFENMVKLLIAADLLCEVVNTAGETVLARATSEDPLELYWVVPPARDIAWSQKAPKNYLIGGIKKKERTRRKVVIDCMKDYVVQYALEMPLSVSA